MLMDTTRTNPAVPMTDAEIYNAAADYMDKYGHCQKAYESAASGAVCVVGALFAVTGSYPTCCNDRGNELATKLSVLLSQNIIAWNDRPERTKAEAVALLRRAAQT